ncbi:MAG: methyltransferase domain-containing protein [Phycisphaeraceae bacterium]|nr:MAG: methyltransferase domain-containing protein [Phycisphaeraceae bacterium]
MAKDDTKRTKRRSPPASAPGKPHTHRHKPSDGLLIVHEDDDLIVVDKPPGLASVAPPGHPLSDNLFSRIKKHVRERAHRRGTRAWVIHRLDREASGLLVFAKSELAYASLKNDFKARRAERRYSAVVAPAGAAVDPLPDTGIVRSFVHEDDRGVVHSSPTPPRGRDASPADPDDADDAPGPLVQSAVTHYRVVTRGRAAFMMDLRLETGRKHQIRVHMKDLKHPIAGDRVYGSGFDPIGRLALHARELVFPHPADGREMRFTSPPPTAFLRAVGPPAPATRPADAPTSNSPTTPPPPPARLAASTPKPASLATARAVGAKAEPDRGWDHVAGWYDSLVEEKSSDHHERVIMPGVLRLLALTPGTRFLDVACGQGVLCRRAAALGASTTGVDASPRLIDTATARDPAGTYLAADARDLEPLALGPFDAAACVMALMNIDPISPVTRGIASALAPGGRFVAVVLHPAFRALGKSAWGWDEPPRDQGRPKFSRTTPPAGKPRPADRPAAAQYRRIDAYLSPWHHEVVMNPGAAASGAAPVVTVTHHRPIQAYIKALSDAGLLVDALEEWPSVRVSQPGPRAAEENRARREIPMFLALRAVKR